ncbi:restriction endonuclease subunit S [Iningainema tapete]|uniref:Restriction endonuclease subunit S n=1 Tax=Iningainema tapete BLCC-T55 TaxID=2748662 RepID=A0A8J6XVP3_9CYAN|nr:restriction endonuclease subunit S [Iningainema tapete]MBD2777067.1 restriction endonuclease subunit S [Iningainema tapete BLCC-T55]
MIAEARLNFIVKPKPWKLPNQWEWVPLEEICDIVIGGTPSRNNHKYWGFGHTWVSISDLNGEIIMSSKEQITDLGVASSNVKLIDPGTVLISFKLTIGKLGIAGKQIYTNEAIAALPIKIGWQTKFYRDFLFYALKVVPLSKEVDLSVKGKTLNKKKIAKILLPIPYLKEPTLSINIQRRIVARIEALLAEVRESRGLINKMRQDAERLMGTALSEVIEKLDEQYPNSPTISQLISSKKIHIEGGGTPSRSNENYWNGLIPWISPKDMKRWYIKDAQEHISHSALQETAVKLIPEGSVLIVVRGMILAHTMPVGINQNEVTINQDMKALVPSNNLLPDYLGYILRTRSPLILQQVETAAHGTKRLKTDTLVVPTNECRWYDFRHFEGY